jgi:hypothetical protein
MQVERTLVKSPPELWAEVSEVESLARHLAEFGEITITRAEPESKVAWEGEYASGTVELTASGWGTKVTLTAEMAAVEAEAATEPIADPLPPAAVEPEADPLPPAATKPEAAGIEGVEPVSPPLPAPDSLPPAATASPTRSTPPSKRSWLRFWRRPSEEPDPPVAEEPDPPVAEDPEPPVAEIPGPPAPPMPDPAPPTPTPQPGPPVPDPAPPVPTPQPGPPAPPDPNPPQIAFDPERTQAVLTQVLDDLGQAHHRPFSRS